MRFQPLEFRDIRALAHFLQAEQTAPHFIYSYGTDRTFDPWKTLTRKTTSTTTTRR